MNTDFLIVGSGFYGSVLAERIASILKKKVLVIEKRNHIGGNCYSEFEKITKIEYHKYGTHIFHTSNKRIWDYINQFTKFNNYKHQVLTNHRNKIYQMPINLETINSFFNKNLNPDGAKKFLKHLTRKQHWKPKNFEEKAISQIGEKLYRAFIKNYTIKQWGINPKKLPASIFNRLPIRFNYNEDYFKNSDFQGIPLDGYTQIFKNLLHSKRITTLLNSDYFKIREKINVKYSTIYTGPIDQYFNYKYGILDWRSVKFKKTIFNCNDFQGNSVINYPDLKFDYTRIHEPRHLHAERRYLTNKTLVIKEYSYQDHKNPYYPINNESNKKLIAAYKKLAKKEKNVLFGGRLADYAYYDMDMTISASLVKFESIKKNF